MELRIDKSGPHDRSRPEIEDVIESRPSPAVGVNTAVTDARINYLKMMTMTLLTELSSLTEDRREPATRRIDLKAEVLRFESELIRSALQTTHGQQRRAARLLGTNATTLNTKLKRLGIGVDDDVSDNFPLSQSSEVGFTDDDGHPLAFVEAMDRYEVGLIRNALMHTGGNQTKAARLLQIPITTLNSKIKKLGVDVTQYSMELTTDLPSLGFHNSSFENHWPSGGAR